jgi:hypothetical protein
MLGVDRPFACGYQCLQRLAFTACRRRRSPLVGEQAALKRTLESTNPCESMLEIVRRTQRNVKRWSSGETALRWTAAGMLEAERQFRKIIGYRDLATLVIAIERDHDRRRTHSDAARTFVQLITVPNGTCPLQPSSRAS